MLTLTHGSLHVPHDEAVLVVQKLHPDLCDLQDNKKIKDTKMSTTVVMKYSASLLNMQLYLHGVVAVSLKSISRASANSLCSTICRNQPVHEILCVR